MEEQKVEEKVVVSETEMAEANKKIDEVETEKVVAAKQEGYEAAKKDSTIEKLELELKAVRDANVAAEAERIEEAKKLDLQSQIEAEKAKAEESIQKRIVKQVNNPTVQEPKEQEQEVIEPAPQQHDNLEQAVRQGRFSATYDGD